MCFFYRPPSDERIWHWQQWGALLCFVGGRKVVEYDYSRVKKKKQRLGILTSSWPRLFLAGSAPSESFTYHRVLAVPLSRRVITFDAQKTASLSEAIKLCELSLPVKCLACVKLDVRRCGWEWYIYFFLKTLLTSHQFIHLPYPPPKKVKSPPRVQIPFTNLNP